MPSIGAALFGNSASRSQNKNLVEFRAGKMTMKGKMVHPDKRKGLLYIYQSDDSLMHFCWKDRTSGSIEDDLIIFPDDCEFKRVAQCTTGRVYVLKFKSSNRKFFFWVQEPKSDKDEENARKINEVLNNPPTPGSQRTPGTPGEDLQSLLSHMSQQQLTQLFGGLNQTGLSSILGSIRPSTSQSSRSTPSTTSAVTSSTTSAPAATPSTPVNPPPKPTTAAPGRDKPPASTTASASGSASAPTGSSHNPIQLSDLQNFLTGLGVTPLGGTPAESQPNVDLSSSITMENLQAVLNDPKTVQALQQHLPSGGSGNLQDQLRSTLASPQFSQALNMFSTALRSGQLGPVVSQLEVGPDAVSAANQGNMEEFVRALQNASISQQQSEEPKQPEKRKKMEEKKPDGDDDDNMALD